MEEVDGMTELEAKFDICRKREKSYRSGGIHAERSTLLGVDWAAVGSREGERVREEEKGECVGKLRISE